MMSIKEITPTELHKWLLESPSPELTLIDVREPHEHQIASVEGFSLIPMSSIPSQIENIPSDKPVIIMCHHGGRSMQIAQYLNQAKPDINAYNLTGGIDAWSLTVDSTIERY